ncbi:MAG TPA: hypothetical protein VEP90_04610 [Methylomirabilota bacterium]|nr:hypothetical protein [Methylomirabilota bacterium]
MAAKSKKKINAKQIGSPGTNLGKPTQPTYLKVGGNPAYSAEPDATPSTNPRTDRDMINGAMKVAKANGIAARFGGNQARKCDIDPYSADDLAKAAKANSFPLNDK